MLLRKILSAARIELLEPRPQKPSYRHLLHIGVAVIQSGFNRLTNTGRAWTVGETTLQTSANETDYLLSGVVGKILDVTTNYDPQNGEYEYQVPFADFTDMSEGWQEGWGHGAQKIAFYRNPAGQLYVRVRPMPSDSKTYRVAYSVGDWASDMGLDDSPLLTEHHHLWTAKIARDSLPAAQWSDDLKANEAQRVSLDRSLSRRIEEYEREFNFHIASLSMPRSHNRAEAFPIE